MKMVAKRFMTYAGRRLKAGDEFEPRSNQDARLLRAVGSAEDAPARRAPQPKAEEPERAPPPPMAQVEEPPREDMAELRKEYERVVGKRPWNGWDAATLREKMAEARASSGSYARRDMRAED